MKSDQFYALFPRANVKYFVEDENNNVLFRLKKDDYDDVGEPAFWEGPGVKYLGLSPEDFKLYKENPLKFLNLYKEKHYFHRIKNDDDVNFPVLIHKFWDPQEWSYNPVSKPEKINLKLNNVDFENFRIYVSPNQLFVLNNKLKILDVEKVDEIDFNDDKNLYCLGLKVMYILSYLGGMSIDNLNSKNNLAKSLAYFYFYYHLKKFYNYRNFSQYDTKPLENVGLFKSLYHWSNHKVHFYPHMKMGDSEFKKNKDDVIANIRKLGKWITWQERGKKRDISQDYKKLILIMGKGLTKIGQLLFQESCQAYVYCVLGSQAKTRWKIIGDGANSLQTQRVFLTLVDEIVAQNNLSTLIKSMRLAIKQTNVRLDFVISPGLELIPSEMIYIKDSPGYNNVLLISNASMRFGANSNVNTIEKRLEVKSESKSKIHTSCTRYPSFKYKFNNSICFKIHLASFINKMEGEDIIDTPKIEEPITKKDPKRVEQGKRLAAISKQAKEEKMRKKIYEENFSYLPYIIYTVAGLSSFGFVYLLLFGEKKKDEPHPMTIIREDSKKAKFQGFD